MTDNNTQSDSIFGAQPPPLSTDQLPPPLTANDHADNNTSSPAMAEAKSMRFKFHGQAGEYFGIWIVNIVLTIITLSFYAPWAKVRRLRYFYQNTEFYQRRFDFTGVPTRILIGRLIALALWGIYLVSSNIDVRAAIAGMILIYAAIPWLVRATLRFTARNSKFSNSRFYFAGSTSGAYKQFILGILVTIFTLGIFAPVATWLYKRYIFDHLYAGQLKFKLNTDWSSYMTAVYIPLFVLFAGLMLIGIFSWASLSNLSPENMEAVFTLFSLFYVAVLLVIYPWIQARLYIATWNGITLNNSQFKTECTQGRYTWIVASNWLARIVSLGLLTPWAEIRLRQYQVDSMILILNDDPNQLENMAQSDPSAIAEEISDIFDFDISL